MPQSKFKWNKKASRYTLRGRFVARSEIRKALDQSLKGTAKRVAELSLSLRSGRISLIEWERLMRINIKDAHLYSRALAKGGWAQMTQSDFGKVGRVVKDQYAYLNRFASQLEDGLLLDGRFVARTEMYVEAGRSSYYNALDEVQLLAGFEFEQNILHSAEHCNGCIEETAKGVVPIGSLLQIGDRDCLTRCKCEKVYS